MVSQFTRGWLHLLNSQKPPQKFSLRYFKASLFKSNLGRMIKPQSLFFLFMLHAFSHLL